MKFSSIKLISLACTLCISLAFNPIRTNVLRNQKNLAAESKSGEEFSAESLEIFESAKKGKISKKSQIFGIGSLMTVLLTANEATAKSGEFGIWEGRSFALLHPIVMGSMFAVSGYSAILGLRWRELRTMGKAIDLVKEKAPVLSSGQKATLPFSTEIDNLNGEISKMEASDPKVAALRKDLSTLAANKSVDEEYETLLARRKLLSQQNVRDKHYEMGSILLALGVFAAIEGPVNTYLRAGKLFPGPHLYAGAGIVVLWAIAASLVQQMQKGNEYARLAHIGINFGILGLFAWQVNTGLQITEKVLQFTKWP